MCLNAPLHRRIDFLSWQKSFISECKIVLPTMHTERCMAHQKFWSENVFKWTRRTPVRERYLWFLQGWLTNSQRILHVWQTENLFPQWVASILKSTIPVNVETSYFDHVEQRNVQFIMCYNGKAFLVHDTLLPRQLWFSRPPHPPQSLLKDYVSSSN